MAYLDDRVEVILGLDFRIWPKAANQDTNPPLAMQNIEISIFPLAT